MRKFLAVAKREYFKVVWAKAFILSTLLAPVFMLAVTFVPMLMFSIKGNAVRIAVVGDNSRFYNRFRDNLSTEKQNEKLKEKTSESIKGLNISQEDQMKQTAEQMGGNFAFEEFNRSGKTDEQIQQELNDRIKAETLDAYLIVPPDFDAKSAKFELYSRNSSDFVSENALKDALNDSVRSERLAKANISEEKLKELGAKITLDTKSVDKTGEVKESKSNLFFVGLAVAMLLYLTITIYGNSVLAAVLEEKETKIAEILFSSAKPFELMLGKLVGVGLAGLTQVGIWLFCASLLITYGVLMSGMSGIIGNLPDISISFVILFFIFFALGFFLTCSIFAIVGSIVTTTQEGGQFAMPITLLQAVGIYGIMPIIRDPNSTFSTVISMIPFVSPITMPVRILTEMPPFWQIGLSILLNCLAIALVIWVAARVYRVGMLMYGKRATIPEVWRWILAK
jgi:ABC-2 type transport system permease protein